MRRGEHLTAKRTRSKCKECGWASMCVRKRQRTYCRQCSGTSICEHNLRRRWCKEFIAHLRAQAENDHYSVFLAELFNYSYSDRTYFPTPVPQHTTHFRGY